MVRVAPINLTFNPRTLWFDPGDLDIEKDMPVVVRTADDTTLDVLQQAGATEIVHFTYADVIERTPLRVKLIKAGVPQVETSA